MVRILMVLLLSASAAIGQTEVNDRFGARCDGPYELCGLRDWQTGEAVGPQNYEMIDHFSEGLAPAALGGKWGYIDTTGVFIVPPKFDKAEQFAFGLAPVLVDNKVGIIDKSGTMIVPPRFRAAFVLSDRIVAASDGTWNGRFFHLMSGSVDYAFWEPIAGLYDVESGWLTEQRYAFDDFAKDNASDLIWAKADVDGDELFGLMRISDGSWLVEPSFRYVVSADYDRRPISIFMKNSNGNMQLFRGERDRFGKAALVAQSGGLTCPDGTNLFRTGELWGMHGSDGKVLFPAEHRAMSCFDEGVVWLPVPEEGKWCAFGPDAKRREMTDCKKYYNGYRHSWGFDPEKLHEDPFESSILWMRKMLAVLESPLRKGPALLSDDKEPEKSEVRCWECFATPY
jgi:hypothetical protein